MKDFVFSRQSKIQGRKNEKTCLVCFAIVPERQRDECVDTHWDNRLCTTKYDDEGDSYEVCDNYQYAMTVEWDQKDLAFKTKELETLSRKVGELMQKDLTSQDVNLLIETRFKNSQVAEAAKLKLALMGD